MKNSQQYPIGTIFRKDWGEGIQEFKILEYRDNRPISRMTYLNFTETDGFNPLVLIDAGFEVIPPKSDNFNSLYNKLNGTAQGG